MFSETICLNAAWTFRGLASSLSPTFSAICWVWVVPIGPRQDHAKAFLVALLVCLTWVSARLDFQGLKQSCVWTVGQAAMASLQAQATPQRQPGGPLTLADVALLVAFKVFAMQKQLSQSTVPPTCFYLLGANASAGLACHGCPGGQSQHGAD